MAAAASAPAQTSLLMVADFESNDLAQLGTQRAQADSLSIVTSPVHAGKCAARTLLRASDLKVNGGSARLARAAEPCCYPSALRSVPTREADGSDDAWRLVQVTLAQLAKGAEDGFEFCVVLD